MSLAKPWVYRADGLTIASELELPELLAADEPETCSRRLYSAGEAGSE